MMVALSIRVVSCVSGPPKLTHEQTGRLREIKVYKEGETPSEKYKKLADISAADYSGAPGGGRV